MSKEVDVRFSYSSIAFPLRAFIWKNSDYIRWAKETGYISSEFFPFRASANEIFVKNINVIASLDHIKSGHVVFNPYATTWSVLIRKEDRLRKGVPLGWYNLAFVENRVSIQALKKLDERLSSNFYVVTYPYDVNGVNLYGSYKNQVLQTHPAVFNDKSTAEDIIELVKRDKYQGVAWDTFHALEAVQDGTKPLGDWKKSIGKLLEARVIKEIHVQAGRVREKYSPVPDMSWLHEMTGESPRYGNELGQMMKMVKEHDKNIPFVIEINLEGLLKAGLIDKIPFFSRDLEKVQAIHRELIDYVKRV